jgi:hypothetical protein
VRRTLKKLQKAVDILWELGFDVYDLDLSMPREEFEHLVGESSVGYKEAWIDAGVSELRIKIED